MLFILWLWACSCGDREPELIVPTASHFGSFHALVDAATEPDLETAKWIARSLQEGDVPQPIDDGGGAEEVGGGLGFVQIAEDSDEVIDGLAAAAVGCGKCHAAAAVERPEMGVWSHESGGLRMVLGSVFPPAEAPPPEVDELVSVSIAWDEAEGGEADRLAAALRACVACHESKR